MFYSEIIDLGKSEYFNKNELKIQLVLKLKITSKFQLKAI